MILDQIKKWLLQRAVKGFINVAASLVTRMFTDEKNRSLIGQYGFEHGVQLGDKIPTEALDGFAAAYFEGVAAGLRQKDQGENPKLTAKPGKESTWEIKAEWKF